MIKKNNSLICVLIEKRMRMNVRMLCLLMFFAVFSAFGDENVCSCECHNFGAVECNKCDIFHSHDQCGCWCHDKFNAKSCGNCDQWHNQVERDGIDDAIRYHQRLRPKGQCQSQRQTNSQHQHRSHNNGQNSKQVNRHEVRR